MDLSTYKKLVAWSEELDGVFTLSDLKIAFANTSSASMYRDLQVLIKSGDLIKIKRGYYATPAAKLTTIAARLYPKSYISTGTVLAAHKIIGSIPERKIQVILTGTPSTCSSSLGKIEVLSIAPKMFCGFERRDDAYWATPEKAYLDACYFYFRGRKYSFDLESDVDRSRLKPKLIETYLRKYDKRFITFFRDRFWRANGR